MRGERLAWMLLVAHAAALVFGVGGIVVALERPELWAHLDLGRRVYAFGMRYGGVLYICFGAAALFAWGTNTLGWRKTVSFFALSTSLSLGAELIGTSTGWPFGNYAYTSGLGPKIFDRVPFTIPLSWFTMGLASWLLGSQLAHTLSRRKRSVIGILVGVWLLVVWDLVLDPAMAHEAMQARFWVWHQTGRYFGMPLVNFAGWALTGVLFMTAGRLAWRSDPPQTLSLMFPFAVYAANIAFASALCVAVGLWQPVLLALLGGLLPATVALVLSRARRHAPKAMASRSERAIEVWSWRFLRLLARSSLRGRTIELVGHSPPQHGPVVLAPQHVHHLDDGRALLAVSERPLHFVVALDWVPTRLWRAVMERLCALAGWPVIVRPRELERPGVQYGAHDGWRTLVAGLREAIARLSREQLLVIFPEGYPLVDPHLPNRRAAGNGPAPGAIWVAKKVAERLRRPVPVFPVLLQHERDRTRIWLRTPILIRPESDVATELGVLAASLDRPGERFSGTQRVEVRRG